MVLNACLIVHGPGRVWSTSSHRKPAGRSRVRGESTIATSMLDEEGAFTPGNRRGEHRYVEVGESPFAAPNRGRGASSLWADLLCLREGEAVTGVNPQPRVLPLWGPGPYPGPGSPQPTSATRVT